MRACDSRVCLEGTPRRGMGRLLRGSTREIARDDDFDARRGLEAELGYGLRGLDVTGVLTPCTGASWGDEGDRTILRTGARWQIAPETVLGFEAARARRSTTAPADAAIRTRIETRW